MPIDKLWRIDGVVVGGVGTAYDISAMRTWVVAGRRPETFPTVTSMSNFVIVTPARGLIRYTNTPMPTAHGFNKCAFGTGRDFAYGALHMGATAVEAVAAAIKYHTQCGSGIQSYICDADA
jgi:ATP-dependent HslUV protease subunit HslV